MPVVPLATKMGERTTAAFVHCANRKYTVRTVPRGHFAFSPTVSILSTGP